MHLLVTTLQHTVLSLLQVCLQVKSLSQFRQHIPPLLQHLLGHDMFACGLAQFRSMQVRHICNISFPDGFLACRMQSDNRYRSPLSDAWQQSGQPQYLNLHSLKRSRASKKFQAYRDFGINGILGHGLLDATGEHATFFGFAQFPDRLDARHAQLVGFVMPHLHLAYCSALQGEGMLPAHILAAADAPAEKQFIAPVEAMPPQLSAREREILYWLFAGKSNWDIGMILGISEWTIKNHVQNILKKLHARNRQHAVALALKAGWIQP